MTIANRRVNMQRMQNVLLIWLDININVYDVDCNDKMKQLKRVVNNLNTFTDDKQCLEFIQKNTNNKICMVVSGSLGKRIVPHVRDISQVDSIFIFCHKQDLYKQLADGWFKIKGVFTDITSVCEALKKAARQCEQDATSISIVEPNKTDQLDPSFMYSQVLKEILLTIDFEEKHITEFIQYYRGTLAKNSIDSRTIEELKGYRKQQPIWWYSSKCYLYLKLNEALRLA